MDIRQPACKLIASVLSGLLILNPLVAAAAELAVDAAAGGNTQLGVAGNGVPVVNIATPDGAGLSHNKFSDYSVGQNGLILNNATGKTQSTQLGGIIIGNPNLKGAAATKILNEVTGANRSQLRGYTEVAGQSAHVIVANPHGITCNGCGFINTPRATLTTGRPVLNGGRLQGYDVDGGEIAIEGAGLNAGNLDQFELITRSARLNAELYANQLTVVTGRNQVDAETLAATAKADNGSAKPQLAIDSSALGGMYAGAIRLVGTEQGVGVKLAGNLAASAGDIQLDANGQLSLAQTSTVGSLRAKAQDIAVNGPAYAAGAVELTANGQLSNSGQLAAGSRVQLQGAQVSNNGIVEAGVNSDNSRNTQGDVAINSQTLRNSGSVVASRNLDVNASGSLDNQGGSLRGSNTTLGAGSLSNNQGRVLAANALSLSGQQLSNIGGQVGAPFIQVRGGALDNRLGLFSAEQSLNLQLGNLNNQGGTLSSRGALVANISGTLDNSQAGKLISEGAQHLRAGQLSNQNGGRVSSRGPLDVQADSLDNRGGKLVSDATLNLAGGSLDNRDQGLVSAGQDLQLTLDSLNNAGAIQSDASLHLNARTVSNAAGGQIAAKGNLNAQLGSLTQSGGELLSQASLQVLAQQIDNHQGGWIGAMQGINLQAAALFNQSGEISSRGALSLRAASVDNSTGRIASDGLLDVHGDSLVNRAGSLVGQGGLSVTGRSLDNSQGGQLLSEGALNLSAQRLDNRQGGWVGALHGIEVQASELFNQGGEISSRASVNIDVGQLDNSAGLIASDDRLTLRGDSLVNRAGSLVGQGGLSLNGGSLDNSQRGTLSSLHDLDLNLADSLDNQAGGQLLSEGTLNLGAAQVDNRAGVLSSGGALRVTGNALNNQGGKLLTDATLSVDAQTLDNRQNGVISAKGALTLRGATLLNSQAGRILAGADLLLTQTRVDNSGQGRIEAAGRVSGQVKALDQHDAGRLIGSTGIDLDFAGGSLDNSGGGLLASPGALSLRNLAQLNNSTGGEISSQQSFLLALADLNNQGGRILSSDALTLQVQGAVDNSQAGVLFGRNQLQLNAAGLNNSLGGTVASQGAIQANINGALDNHADGAMAAGGSLSVGSTSLNNQGGSLSGGQDLTLVTGTTDNQHGRITAQGQLHATTGDLDNRHGILSGQQGQRLQAQAIDNRAGVITTLGRLELGGSRLDNGLGGELSAGGTLQLRVQQLIQQQGRLITGGDLSLDLAGGDFDNQGAVLSVGGLLRIDNLRHLDNRGGEISSQHSFQLNSASLDNGDAGRIISAGQLQLSAGSLRNANLGLLSGWQGLAINAADLDNSSSGTLSSKLGKLDVTLSGRLDNHGEGALVSLGDQHIRAASLNNQGGILSGQGNLDLTIASTLNNSAGGLINAQQHLALRPAQTDILNQGGQISAGSLDFSVRSLDNSGGLLLSQGALRGTLRGTLSGALINANNARLASAGELLLSAASLDNRGGQLASQQRLELNAGSLDNSQRGTLASQQDLVLNLGAGTLDNSADGLLHSASGAISLQAGQLRNQGGTLNSQGDAQLQLSGLLDNSQQGRIQSRAGGLLLQSANLDNSAGGILHSATGLLRVLTGSFNNAAGITQARSLDITARGGIDNRGGHLSAVGGDNRLTTTTLDNQGGGLYAGNLLSLGGDTLLNQGGQIGATTLDFSLGNRLVNQNGLIESAGSLSLTAGAIDNQGGRLRALGQSGSTTLNAGYLDNRGGRLETANTDLALNLGGLANDGGAFLHVGSGQFGVNAGQIAEAGGSFVTTGHLDITADSWSNSSVLQAGWLTLNIGQFTQTASGRLLASQGLTGRGGHWSNDGLLASDGSLDIQLSGTYGGAGRVTSLGALNLAANQLDISQGASVTGGQGVTLGAGTLNNRGRITAAGDLTANTGSLNNLGTLGSAGKLRINTWDLLNDGQSNGALIFSGGDMTLRVGGSLINRYADIYSLGNLDITGATPEALAGALKNISATVESLGDMSLKVRTTENRTDVLNTTAGELLSAAIGVRCYDCSVAPQPGERTPSSHMVWVENYRGELGESSPSAAISAGGNLKVEGQNLLNQASTIAASGNISMMLDSFTNSGVAIGDHSVRRSFEIPYGSDAYGGLFSGGVSFWDQVMEYNAANDPDYDAGLRSPTGDMTRPNLHFWNRGWDESLSLVTIRQGGREAPRFAQFGSIRLDFPGTSPFADFQMPHYQPGALVDAPAVVKNATFFDELTIQSPGSSFVSAVVQAGGNVAINATQDLKNSVIREGVPQSSGASRVGDTGVAGNSANVVALNAQLPPDLAQQQVNPVTLPGFSLPTGSNGLFRLSGQEGTQSSAQTVTGDGNYSFAGQSISLSQRERTIDATTSLTADLQRSDATTTGTVQRSATSVDSTDSVQLNGAAAAQGAAASASLNVAQVQGVPSTARPDNRHKYLIETNPELTSLKSFLGSDYLLGQLGYDPDHSQKRLGDGLYEQCLIRDAVIARTGQRYIDGLTSDEGLFKYLMDNAIAYKDSLHLSLGVGLTAEQVAALTHDLVWLEEAIVNGEKVLVPVVYLAQANNRLAPNGALIQGQNLSLISGGNLLNQGTLRASGDLAASAANLDNSGLIEASGRLDLLALNTLSNTQGGIIKGRDVSLSALTGDVINQRSVTVHEGGIGNRTWTQSFADSTARIEAAGKLDISAGRDINNLGGAISSGSDLAMQAGRDINLHSVELENGTTRGRNYNQSTTQLGSEISVGRDFTLDAGRDISVVGSRIDVGRDAGISAGRDVTLASAADEQHSYDKSKKVTTQEDHVTQRGTELSAGRDVLIAAGNDLTLISSKVSAGNEAYLVAGDKIAILAANDSDYSLYDKKDKGAWGSKQTRHDEVTDVKAVSSEISAGGDITLLSGGDQKYQAAKLDAGNDIAIVSGGAVTFEAVKDLHQEAHSKEDSDLSWSSSSGKGRTDETVRQSELIAQGNLAIKAVDGLKIDYKQIDKASVSQAIDAMVKADPNLAWLKDAEQRGDVDWRAVKEFHDSYSYSNSGMGAAPSLAIAIVAAAYLGPIVGPVASNLAVGTINNGGDVGQGLKYATNSDALKSYAIAAAMAYITPEYFDKALNTQTNTITDKVSAVDLSTVSGASRFAANQAMQSLTNTALNKAMGQGGSFGDALKDSVYNTFAAVGFNAIGDFGVTHGLKSGDAQMVVMHALMGGLAAQARGDSFAAGAIGAGLNEAVVADLDKLVSGYSPENREAMLTMASQLTGLIGVVAIDPGASYDKLETGAWSARNSTQYNYLNHTELAALEKESSECKAKGNCAEVKEKFRALSVANDDQLASVCAASPAMCIEQYNYLVNERQANQLKIEDIYSNDAVPLSIKMDLPAYNLQNINATGTVVQAGVAQNLVEKGVSQENASLAAAIFAAVTGGMAGKAKGGATAPKPLVSKGADVTPEVIQKALQGDKNISAQNAVSLPAVQRYVDRLLAGEVAPAIKMDGNVIVDGNHRYIAAKILGREPDVVPGTLSPSKVDRTKPVVELKIDPTDWGNK
ncbi:DUF637 domain-containing protein [Pseudomonas sp. SCB32]|uniref:two-partner secretion domain-containing protein n=1 Tax=Pseudomonas sp. SCB32 TaxID=2653853 RepID=UPI00126483CC|nr:DUF637 domain-containing protein [Pseudomonas sp. SCB32]